MTTIDWILAAFVAAVLGLLLHGVLKMLKAASDYDDMMGWGDE